MTITYEKAHPEEAIVSTHVHSDHSYISTTLLEFSGKKSYHPNSKSIYDLANVGD